MKDKLQDRKKVLEDEFAKLVEATNSLNEERRQIDKKLSDIRVRQLQLQGSYKEIEELMKDDEPQKDKKK